MSGIRTYFLKKFSSKDLDEKVKFIKMGSIFCTILATYWTLGTIKESLLSNLIGTAMLPYAKIASLFLLMPALLIYSRLLDLYLREKLFIGISLFYAIFTIIFAYLIDNSSIGEAQNLFETQSWFAQQGTRFLCFSFYAFVESYGSLLVSLFWSIATSTTQPESAKKGFPLIVGLGQLGGIFGPLVLCSIPRFFHLKTSSISVYISALLILLSCILLRYFLVTTPQNLLQPFIPSEDKPLKSLQQPRFFEGLHLIIKNYYLLGIFFGVFFFEFITQLFDYYFKCFAAEQFSGLKLAEFLGFYGSAINFVTLLFLLLGINKINSFFGISYSLLVIPTLIGFSIIGFMLYQNIAILFFILVLLKAINFALTIPTIKQLYIPTSFDVRYKAQAWIDTFGSRLARQSSGIYALMLNSLQKHTLPFCVLTNVIRINHYFFISLVFFWFFIALFLGRKHSQAIKNKSLIC